MQRKGHDMNRHTAFRMTGAIVTVFALVEARALGQQQGPSAPTPANWGTAGISVHTLGSFAFQPIDGTAVYAGDIDAGRYIVSGGSCWAAPVLLPTGALIDHMEIAGCDNSDTSDLVADFVYCVDGTSCPSTYPITTTGAPGCRRFSSLRQPLGVDNGNWTYYVKVCTPGGSDTTFTSVRLYFQLQVSPAPGTPTFLDVPTDNPFYQYVQALVAAGLTAGCGGGNYCPDSPVTRGQLALFLAKALGLYWTDTISAAAHP